MLFVQSSFTLKKLVSAAASCQAATSESGGADVRPSRDRSYSLERGSTTS